MICFVFLHQLIFTNYYLLKVSEVSVLKEGSKCVAAARFCKGMLLDKEERES